MDRPRAQFRTDIAEGKYSKDLSKAASDKAALPEFSASPAGRQRMDYPE